MSAALAAEIPKPAILLPPDAGPCLAPPDEMRRNHPDMLKHQRDKTVRQGERGAPVSLKACISCHAGRQTGTVAGSREDFCETCHAYAAVKIDCFECHTPKAARLAAGGKS